LADVQDDSGSVKTRTVLTVDEPELYLHPQAIESVRDSLRSLADDGYQVVFATHSPLMVSGKDIPSTSVVSKNLSSGTTVRERLKDTIERLIEDYSSQRKALMRFQNAGRILFSDRVLLVEGDTEERLLPTLFELATGSTLSQIRLALVPLNGAGSIPKSMEILEAMGLDVKALVDLDFVFDSAANRLFESDDPDRQHCRDVHDKRNLNKAEEAKRLAESGKAEEEIARLHDKLKEQGYWLWPGGDFEYHFGVDGKDEDAWAEYLASCKGKTFNEAVSDPLLAREMIEWLDDT
jgi:predicted ATP-dependent endonuclease of OLD family